MAFPRKFPGREAGLLRPSWQTRCHGPIRRGRAGFDRHKTPKRSLAGLSKAHQRWYIPLAPRGFGQGLPSQEAFGRNRRLKALAKPFRLSGKGSQRFIAGWSSPVARQAHNLKVRKFKSYPRNQIKARQLNELAGFFMSKFATCWVSKRLNSENA